jgi:hypothetical protein
MKKQQTFYRGILFLIGVLLLIGLTSKSYSQKSRYGVEEGQSGTIYAIAIPDTSGNTEDARHPTIYPDNVYFMIYSGVDQTLEMLKPNGGLEKVILKAKKISKYEVITAGKVKGGNPQITIPNLPQANKLFVLRSEQPIVVYVMFDTRFGTEAWTPLPAESWGTDYYSVGVPGQPINNVFTAGEYTYSTAPKLAVGQFVVAALDSDTHVSLTDPTYTSDVVTHRYYPSDTKISFTLNENFANLIESDVDTLQRNLGVNQPDAGGIRVTTDKPVGMISGNTRTMGGIASGSMYGCGKTTMLNMLMEAVAPIETHGKEFVYMPTWDSRRPTDIPPAKGKGGVRLREYGRFYGTSKNDTSGDDVTNIELTNPGPIGLPMRKRNVKLGQGTLVETITGINGEGIEFDPRAAYYMKADKPTQATKISTSVSFVVANSTDGSGTYNTWAPFMVEMVPVEQWVTFAPGFTPVTGTYDNNLNICTDSLNKDDIELVNEGGSVTKINFNRKIPGSPYVWTNVGLNSAMKFIVQSKSGKGKFFGDVSGTGNGSEQYQPGTTKKKDDDKNGNETQGGGKDKVLHPSDYYTTNSHSYGYPLAPNRITLGQIDSLELKIKKDCNIFEVQANLIGMKSPKPAGFRTVRLVDPKNAKLLWITPSKVTGIIGASTITFQVVPIDPSKNAEATVEVISKTGQSWTIPYFYEAERLEITPDKIDFGSVSVGAPSDIKDVVATNTLKKTITITQIKLEKGTNDFEIVSFNPSPLPVQIKEGQSITIKVRINPTKELGIYQDVLVVKTECGQMNVPLHATGEVPCIYVGDLDFGTLKQNTSKQLPLKIENNGKGLLTFEHPSGQAAEVLDWLSRFFTVTPFDMAKLKASKLKANEFVMINVTFTSTDSLGLFTTLGKFYTNANCNRDTSVWIAKVTVPGPQITGYDWGKRWVVVPLNNCTKNTEQQYPFDSIAISNTGTADFTVEKIELVGKDADDGFFTLGNNPIISPGDVMSGKDPDARRYQQVFFKPKDERDYTCIVKLTTTEGGTAEGILKGVGIESHVSITGHDFDTTEFLGAGLTAVKGAVKLTAKPTRDLTVTGLQIIGADKADYDFDLSGGFSLPSQSSPWIMTPGEERIIPMLFKPNKPGVKNAIIEVLGDHARCDDSTNKLIGYSYTLGAKPTGFVFGDLLSCDEQNGTTTLTNVGSADIIVTNIDLIGDGGIFILTYPTVPFKLTPGQTVTIPVRFLPKVVGDYKATVVYSMTDEIGKVLPDQTADLTGKSHILIAHGHINRDHHCAPGQELIIPVILDSPLDEAKSKDVVISFRYSKGMMQLVNNSKSDVESDMIKGTILDGWDATVIDNEPGIFTVGLKNIKGDFLKGFGTMLNLRFATYVGDVSESELPWYMLIQDKLNCTDVTTDPGFARLDSICGLNLRLIELISGNYALKQNSPNPFNPSTDIDFEVALDAPTSLVVYNEGGQKVATLVNQLMTPGKYRVTWDASASSSGLYYYRLTSGHWTKTNSMTLQK